MAEETLERLKIGRERTRARSRSGRFRKSPGIFWLGGFKSDMRGTKAEALAEPRQEDRPRLYPLRLFPAMASPGGKFEEGTISRWAEKRARYSNARTAHKSSSVPPWAAGSRSCLHDRSHCNPRPRASIQGMVLIAPAPDFTEALMWPRSRTRRNARSRKKVSGCGPQVTATGPYPLTRALFEDGKQNLLLDKPIRTHCPVRILQGSPIPMCRIVTR